MAARPVLLLLPGLTCDGAAWAPQAEALAPVAACRIVSYGDADSIGAMAERTLGDAPEHFALAGHSMGGRVALELLRRAPDRVDRLALLDTGYQARPAGAAGDDEQALRQTLLALARREGMRAMGAHWAHGMVHPSRHGDAPLMAAVIDMVARFTPDLFEAQIRALLARPDATALLPAIRCPTLILCGREDGWAPLARHAQMAAAVPGARLAVIDDCGHMSTMERPAQVSTELSAWLAARR